MALGELKKLGSFKQPNFISFDSERRLTQHIRYAPVGRLPYGTLLPSVATSYMLETLYAMLKSLLRLNSTLTAKPLFWLYPKNKMQ